MSRPRYWWYYNVARAIKCYPILTKAKGDAQSGSVTANYSGMPKDRNPSRTTENSALRQLAPREESDLYAVSLAIDDMRRAQDGDEVLRVVELYHWKGVHNFETIGDLLHMGATTAKRRNARFVYEVAKNMGYLRRLS